MNLKCGFPSESTNDATFEMLTASGLGSMLGISRVLQGEINLPSTTGHENVRLEAHMRGVTKFGSVHDNFTS